MKLGVWIGLFCLGLGSQAQSDELGDFDLNIMVHHGTDFSVQLSGNHMLLVNTQNYPEEISLDQARSGLISTTLPAVFSRSVKIKKMERNRIDEKTVELVTYAEKRMFGMNVELTTYATCVESPVENGWQEDCTVNLNRGDASKVFLAARTQLKCAGLQAPICTQTIETRTKGFSFPVSMKPAEINMEGAIESLHGAGSIYYYTIDPQATPSRAKTSYEQSTLFGLVGKLQPLLEEAKKGKFNKIGVSVVASEADGSFDVTRKPLVLTIFTH